ncbi:MAG: hypothetical protein HY313_09705 [Acidobacteria bacterium]|nr:hypothetical protein [Acidobacteriota bacterium]
MEEKDFFTETEEHYPAMLNCPSCRQSAEYDLRWILRKKKSSLPPRTTEQDQQRFARARSYRVRKDDLVICKNQRCRKRFEISGIQSVVLL